MRGVTIEDCPEQNVKVGKIYKIVQGLIPIPYTGSCDLVIGLGNPDTMNLAWCPPNTCLEIVCVPKTSMGPVVPGDLLMSSTYEGHRREQRTTDPTVPCLEFVHIPSSQVIKPWDLEGVDVLVKGVEKAPDNKWDNDQKVLVFIDFSSLEI